MGRTAKSPKLSPPRAALGSSTMRRAFSGRRAGLDTGPRYVRGSLVAIFSGDPSITRLILSEKCMEVMGHAIQKATEGYCGDGTHGELDEMITYHQYENKGIWYEKLGRRIRDLPALKTIVFEHIDDKTTSELDQFWEVIAIEGNLNKVVFDNCMLGKCDALSTLLQTSNGFITNVEISNCEVGGNIGEVILGLQSLRRPDSIKFVCCEFVDFDSTGDLVEFAKKLASSGTKCIFREVDFYDAMVIKRVFRDEDKEDDLLVEI